MENSKKSILASAAGVVWRRQRILWWVFVLNLVIMALAELPFSQRLSLLDYSLRSERLVRGMDMGVLLETLSKPEVGSSVSSGVMLPQLVYFVLVLFLTGGILTAYVADRRLTTGEFFQGCGAFFWRFVRLLVFLLIVLIPVGIILNLFNEAVKPLENGAYSDRNSFLLGAAGILLLLFLFLAVRLWFDMAQVRAVVEDERAMRRTVLKAFRQTFGNFGQLFWIFLRPLLLGWIIFGVAFWIWSKIPGERFGVSFVLWEIVILSWIGMRLWQRAAEAVWYQRHRMIEPVVQAITPEPLVVSAPAVESSPAPEATPTADSAASVE